MKGVRRVVIDSALVGLLVAASFIAAERWIPMTDDSEAWGQNRVPNINSEGSSPEDPKDELREACSSGAFFDKGAFEQGACNQFR